MVTPFVIFCFGRFREGRDKRGGRRPRGAVKILSVTRTKRRKCRPECQERHTTTVPKPPTCDALLTATGLLGAERLQEPVIFGYTAGLRKCPTTIADGVLRVSQLSIAQFRFHRTSPLDLSRAHNITRAWDCDSNTDDLARLFETNAAISSSTSAHLLRNFRTSPFAGFCSSSVLSSPQAPYDSHAVIRAVVPIAHVQAFSHAIPSLYPILLGSTGLSRETSQQQLDFVKQVFTSVARERFAYCNRGG